MDAQDGDVLGLSSSVIETVTHEGAFEPEMIWKQLRTVYDPEIPVNIVDLGLVYSAEVIPLEDGKRDIEVRMSMTAPGCGMGNVLKADVEGNPHDCPVSTKYGSISSLTQPGISAGCRKLPGYSLESSWTSGCLSPGSR